MIDKLRRAFPDAENDTELFEKAAAVLGTTPGTVTTWAHEAARPGFGVNLRLSLLATSEALLAFLFGKEERQTF